MTQHSGGSRISHWGGGGTEPLGGCRPLMWVLLGKTYAKMKELDPVGGHMPAVSPWIHKCSKTKSMTVYGLTSP